MQSLITILLSAIAIATVLNVVLKRFNMPTVIGYIFTGVIIANAFGVHIHGNETLEHIAEFGVVFLMFTIGLEFSLAHLNSMKKEVFLFGMLQVVTTGFIIAMLAALLTDMPFKTAILVGAGLALSSTAIVLKILNESGKIKTDYGRNAVGILIFQDIAVIPILLMITIFTNHDKSLSELLIETAINAVIALAVLVIIGKYLLSYSFRMVSSTNSKEIYMGLILLVVIGSSTIAHAFGFSYSLGGFIAGMMIADTIYKYQVEADLIPFRDLLLGVFFVSVGLQIDVNVVMDNLLPVLLLVVGVMAVKAVLIFLLLAFAGDKKAAFKTAVTLAQIGEFSLVVFSLISSNKLLDPTSVQIVMVAIVFSMIITPVIINNLDRIVALVIPTKIEDEIPEEGSIGGHVILCGYGSFGRVVSDMLDQAEINHVVVTNNTEDYVKAREAEKAVVFGDPADTTLLHSLNMKEAMNTIIALDDFEEIQQVSAAISMIDPDLEVIAKVQTDEERQRLEEFNHELLLDGNTQVASTVVEQLIRSRLMAREMSQLQYLHDYRQDAPAEAISKVEKEQVRLLEIMMQSFDGLREDRDIMQIKAFHDSFKVLSEIIEDAINTVMKDSKLTGNEYERMNLLLDNQHQLISMNEALEVLGRELKSLALNEQTAQLSLTAVEGLDAVLLTLIDLSKSFDEMDMTLLRNMTAGEGRGMASIREKYLGAQQGLDAETKALLLSSTTHMERLKSLFGLVGENYRKLAEAKS